MKKKNSSSVVYMIFFFVVFLAFAAFAVDATIIYSMRARLQNAAEAAAMTGASGFTYNLTTIDESTLHSYILAKTADAFTTFVVNELKNATASVGANVPNKQVRVTATCLAQPYFLTFLGVSGIRLNAVALAVSEELTVTPNYPGINWVTSKAAYLSDIITNPSTTTVNDSFIAPTIGNYPLGSVRTDNGEVHYDYLTKGENTPLSLGPRGFMTIKLPAPIIDKPGPDLFIKEGGTALEGYYVFVGMDYDPANPYLNSGDIGGGIVWKNISCTGKPEVEDTNGNVGAYNVTIGGVSVTKFFGSGYFDIGATCSDGYTPISMAKYLRIIDDNSENAFVRNSFGGAGGFFPVFLSGEASSATAGADIDYIDVLNHVRLVPPSQWIP